jgi:hypothetical protein
MNGRKREGTVEILLGRRTLRRRKRPYKAQAEVGGDAGREVGRGRISDEGADNKTRRSEGPRLEPC